MFASPSKALFFIWLSDLYKKILSANVLKTYAHSDSSIRKYAYVKILRVTERSLYTHAYTNKHRLIVVIPAANDVLIRLLWEKRKKNEGKMKE